MRSIRIPCTIYSWDVELVVFPDSSFGKDSTCNAGDPGSIPGLGKICWRRDGLPTPVFSGFPGGSAGKEPACKAGGLGSVPELGRSPGEGKGYPLQYSDLEKSMDTVHGVAKSWTRLSNFHFTSLQSSLQAQDLYLT